MTNTTARPIDAVSRAYLLAGLRLGEDVEGFVDAYHGPEELRSEAAELSVEAALDQFDNAVGGMPESHRRDYLAAQARAMHTVAAVQAGRTMPYLDEVEATFGIRPVHVPEETFEQVLAELDSLLPGAGPLAERRNAYRASLQIPTNRILTLAEGLAAALRRRTQGILELPAGEAADIELVHDQPWGGYNWYLGGYRSRIELNTDLPSHINALPDLVAHEIYAGHHTEHCLKERRFLREHGWGEAAIILLTSPQAIISEGIATIAFETLVPERERVAWLQRYAYQPAGIDADVELDLAIQRASKPLRHVSGNAALLIHQDGRTDDEVVEYFMRYGLRSAEEARHSVPFLRTPNQHGYIFTYTTGYDLVSAYQQREGDAGSALARVITEHWTPQRLLAGA